jgi:hypothetical protein
MAIVGQLHTYRWDAGATTCAYKLTLSRRQ